MQTPEQLRYMESHEWASEPEGDIVTVGITDYAQDQLGDVVFVELPEVGQSVAKGGSVAVVESVKTASDIYSPVSGEIVEVNQDLEQSPQLINEGPYDKGWIFKVRLSQPDELQNLMDAAAYQRLAEEA